MGDLCRSPFDTVIEDTEPDHAMDLRALLSDGQSWPLWNGSDVVVVVEGEVY